jgi:hypothetical protein
MTRTLPGLCLEQLAKDQFVGRGRDTNYLMPPAQIPASGITVEPDSDTKRGATHNLGFVVCRTNEPIANL